MPELDWTKPIQTKSGLQCQDTGIRLRGTSFDRVVIVEEVEPGPWQNCLRFNEYGRVYSDRLSEIDLINVPEERVLEGWVNVYGDNLPMYRSKEEADRCGDTGRTECLHITRTYKVGEGLK